MTSPRTGRGFTLVEMMVAVSILAILAASAAPSMTGFVAGQRVKSAASDIHLALQRARAEAIKRNGAAVIAPTGTWASGWTVVAGGTTVETHEPTANVTISGPASVTYGGLGRPNVALPSFSVTSTGTATARCVRVGLTGQPAVTPAACA